jgi:glycosyltransferase involved in cell wall biosynthesis
MGKSSNGKSSNGKSSNSKSSTKTYYPLVSVCTPTFNRRPFISMMFECFKNQTYPKDRIEWIIVDDGTDKINDLVNASKIAQIKYFSIETKMTLGQKRNYMHKQTKGSIIVYMDDDDYYPPERISHAVERLTANPSALCAGSSEIYIYFKHLNQMFQGGPYGPNHATAGTFAFRSELLKQTQYEDSASLAEERAFLKDYTIPFVQLDPLKTILVFSHEHNTFDKRKLLDHQNQYFKKSEKTVETFIRNANETAIKQFFMCDIDKLLANYEVGEPKMKPDVLKQIKEIDIERQKQQDAQNSQNTANMPKIMMNRDGETPVELSIPDVLEIVTKQQTHINELIERIKEMDNIIREQQAKIVELSMNPYSGSIKSEISIKPVIGGFNPIEINSPSKTEPETVFNI